MKIMHKHKYTIFRKTYIKLEDVSAGFYASFHGVKGVLWCESRCASVSND
jgi:hypothetical protein